MSDCRNCDGKGYYVVDASNANESVQDMRKCEECDGTGEEFTYEELHAQRDAWCKQYNTMSEQQADLLNDVAQLTRERDAARAEVERLTRDLESARIGAATIASQEAPPPDGVPGECWVMWWSNNCGNAFLTDVGTRYDGPHKTANYLHASIVTAKVAEEREACAKIADEQAKRFNSEVAVIICERIRARGSKS